MSGRTKIEWAEAADLAEERVVTAHKSSSSAPEIKAWKTGPASAHATDRRIRLALNAAVVIAAAFGVSVCSERAHDRDVCGPVVGLVSVEVMDLFAWGQGAPENLFCDKSVLIDIASNVSQVMAGQFHKHVAVRGDGSASLPVWIPWARVNDSHSHRIARYNPASNDTFRLLDGVEHNAYPGEGGS